MRPFFILPATLVLVPLLAGCATPARVADPAHSTAERCEQLMAYYDRYGRRTERFEPGGWLQRNVGGMLCQQGRYGEGVAELEDAIRYLGFTPPEPAPR